QVIGCVARRMNRGQRPVGAGDHVTALQRNIGLEIIVDEIAARWTRLEGAHPGGRIARKGCRNGTGRRLERGDAVDVVAMCMSRDDVRYWPRSSYLTNSLAVCRIVGTGINDRERRRADQVGVRAFEGKWAGILRD